MWRWLNYHRLLEALKKVPPEDFDLVWAAVEAVGEGPYDPAQVEVDCLPEWGGRPERWVAWLPTGMVLIYRPYLDGPIPYAGKHIVVADCFTLSEVLDRAGDNN